MLKWVFKYRVNKLNSLLSQAIFWDDIVAVRDLLKRGADPDGWAGRQRFLGKALERNSRQIIEALLEAGADPRHPYLRAGMEFKMSEAARLYERHELARILERAEREAEAKYGVLPYRQSLDRTCPLKPRG